MTDNYNKITTDFSNVNLHSNNNLETTEEVGSSESQKYLSGSYRCEKFEYSTSSDSNMTITPNNTPNNIITDVLNGEPNSIRNLQIPIVGYEVMEERARFTVYKLRIENKSTGDCWYVFRRYTDFVRLCARLKRTYPTLAILMPRKKWFGNNFDPTFLEERIQGLQAFINAIILIPELVNNQQITDFFCLNEPPVYSDTTEESRAIFEALEDTIFHLRHQLREKEIVIEHLQSSLNDNILENNHLKTFIRNSTENCDKCLKEYKNIQKENRNDFEDLSDVPLSSRSNSSKE